MSHHDVLYTLNNAIFHNSWKLFFLFIGFVFFYKNWQFMWLLNFLLLCFCFKNLDFLDQQPTQFDFSISTLFVNFIFVAKNYECNLYNPNNTLLPFLSQFLSHLFLVVCFSCLYYWQYFLNEILNIFQWFRKPWHVTQ